VRAPFTGRARRELLFCLLGLPFGIFIPLAGFFAAIRIVLLASGPPWVTRGTRHGWRWWWPRRPPRCWWCSW
jgi:hypothetical protein